MRLMRLVCQALDKFREADDKAGEAGVKSFRSFRMQKWFFNFWFLQTKIAKTGTRPNHPNHPTLWPSLVDSEAVILIAETHYAGGKHDKAGSKEG